MRDVCWIMLCNRPITILNKRKICINLAYVDVLIIDLQG
jgi:hypothetical protein